MTVDGLAGPELLRALSDERVLSALVAAPEPLTRAGLAACTGLSKPTVSQSVSRLIEAGVLAETGLRTGSGRGRAGTLLAVRAEAGVGLAVHAGPDGVVAELVDCEGNCLARRHQPVAVPTSTAALGSALRDLLAGLLRASPVGPVRAVAVSVADPVDRRTGRAVHLPASPFLVGELDPVELLSDLVDPVPLVDNDVNWALRAERDRGALAGPDGTDNAVYVYLDAGLGAAILADGHLIRGHRGLAGEIAYLAPGVDRPGSLLDWLDEHGFVRDFAVQLPAIRQACADPSSRAEIAGQVGGVIRGVGYLLDPEVVLLAGWGAALAPDVQRLLQAQPGLAPDVRAAAIEVEPWLGGARAAVAGDLAAALLLTVQGREGSASQRH